MRSKRVLLIGGGGHCKSVLDSLLTMNLYSEIGIVEKEWGAAAILGIHQVGIDTELPQLFEHGWTDAFITVGGIGNASLRRKLYETIKSIGFSIPSFVDKTAVVAADVKFSEGIFIGKRAVVNVGTKLGVCSIINTGAIVEHDCVVGDFAHISPGAVLCGQVSIGKDCHVGAGSTVRQQLSIGEGAVVGIGSIVTKDVSSHVEAYGNPCRVVKML